MQGHAHIRTLPHIGMNTETQPLLDSIMDGHGEPRIIDDVWISYLSAGGVKAGPLTTGFGANDEKIGPELTFGIYMQQRLGEPILIIKAAWGGKSINTDFRPPGAGPYVFDQAVLDRMTEQGKDVETIKAEKESATGVFYRQTIDHVQSVLANIGSVYPDYDAEQGYELAGLVWFQGWNDMVDGGTYPQRGEPGGYDAYSEVLTHLIRDIRRDLSTPDLPVVIGVMGVGGPTDQYGPEQQRYKDTHQSFRDAMAAPAELPEFKGNVVAVLTENHWDQELAALVARDEAIRGRVNKAMREGKLEALAAQINEGLSEDQRLVRDDLRIGSRRFDQVILKRLQSEEFSPRELEILRSGKSNAAYHYLGCAKIMAGIGKAFAEAMPVVDD